MCILMSTLTVTNETVNRAVAKVMFMWEFIKEGP